LRKPVGNKVPVRIVWSTKRRRRGSSHCRPKEMPMRPVTYSQTVPKTKTSKQMTLTFTGSSSTGANVCFWDRPPKDLSFTVDRLPVVTVNRLDAQSNSLPGEVPTRLPSLSRALLSNRSARRELPSHLWTAQRRWQPQRDSNPCLHLERVVSLATRRWGRDTLASRIIVADRRGELRRRVLG
jgi:hypothetical protein